MESTPADHRTGRHHRIARDAATTDAFLRGVRVALDIGAAGHGRTRSAPRAVAADEAALQGVPRGTSFPVRAQTDGVGEFIVVGHATEDDVLRSSTQR